MPIRIQNRLNQLLTQSHTNSVRSRSVGIMIMGVLSALIVGPCVAPPLVAILTMISQTGNLFLGGATLFIMGLGMGVPILILGASGGHLLPKVGVWMVHIKQLFGYLLLFMALYFASRIMSELGTQIGWIILGTFFLFWIYQLEIKAPFRLIVKQSIVFILGLILAHQSWQVLDLLLGRSEINDIRSENQEIQGQTVATELIAIKGIEGLDRALNAAKGKVVMLEFSADWCVECKRMDKYTFRDSKVKTYFSEMVRLQADVTQNDAQDKALAKRFGLFGPPAMLFFDQTGQELPEYRVMGYVSAEPFSQHLARILAQP